MSDLTRNSDSKQELPALLIELGDLIRQARQRALRAVDTIQVQTCWKIGRHNVQFEQRGATRAVYGKRLLPELAKALTSEFGEGFDVSNLRHIRGFYVAFPIHDALRRELCWTHYRTLLRPTSVDARWRRSRRGGLRSPPPPGCRASRRSANVRVQVAGADHQEMDFGRIIGNGLCNPCGRALANHLRVYRG